MLTVVISNKTSGGGEPRANSDLTEEQKHHLVWEDLKTLQKELQHWRTRYPSSTCSLHGPNTGK